MPDFLFNKNRYYNKADRFVLLSKKRRKSRRELVALRSPIGDFDASLVEGDRHETANPVNTTVNCTIKLASIVCYLYGLIN